MTAATTARIRTFGVGIQRRQRAGSGSGVSIGGVGAVGRVGVVVVMCSPQGLFGLIDADSRLRQPPTWSLFSSNAL